MLWVATTSAQVKNGEFQKLFDLYTMEEYEKCAWKAERYLNNDKYSKSPEPYLYMALCLYQVHVNPDVFEVEYEDPLKDALKYAYKFRKKDKEGTMYEANRVLLDKIREQALDQAKFLFNDGDFRKAASEFNRILKVIPDDVNVVFITGVSEVLSKNVTMGEKNIALAMDTLRAHEANNTFEEDPVTNEVLVKAFISYTDYLSQNNQLEKAMEIIAFSRKLLPNDASLKLQYKKIYAIGSTD